MGRFGAEVIFLAEDDEFSLECRKEEGLVRCSNEDVKSAVGYRSLELRSKVLDCLTLWPVVWHRTTCGITRGLGECSLVRLSHSHTSNLHVSRSNALRREPKK